MLKKNTIKDGNSLIKYIDKTIKNIKDENIECDISDNDTIYEVYKVYDYAGNKRYYESNNYNERWSRVKEMEKEYR